METKAAEANDAKDDGSGATIFMPPWHLITRQVRASAEHGADAVVIPQRLLRFLMRCLLDHIEFDEQQYRNCNPDVAEAIKRNAFSSGRDHFIKVGYFEDRVGGTTVNENWYLARNPDVLAAKQAGSVKSGEVQYRLSGAIEWREPNPSAVNWIEAWKNALGYEPPPDGSHSSRSSDADPAATLHKMSVETGDNETA